MPEQVERPEAQRDAGPEGDFGRLSAGERGVPAPPPRPGVRDIPFTGASEFLRALSTAHELFSEDPPGWIYRGQANANWELKAKAIRNSAALNAFGVSGAFEGHSDLHGLLRDFRKRLDRAGIIIPGPHPAIDHRDQAAQGSRRDAYPTPEVRPIMALAQHHGLPTLLLDWTTRSQVAGYFAAVEAANPQTVDRGTHLALWALYIPMPFRESAGAHEVPLYRPPAGTNPNLRAQSGLFTLPSQLGEDMPSIEQHVCRLLSATGGTLPLLRLTLPSTEAPKLLRLLAYEGIDGSSMFPGPDGVVRAMREVVLWDRV